MRLSNYTKRTFSCVLTYVLCLTLVPPPPARAGVLGGFATEWTQIANNVQLITTYIRQGEQLRQEIMMVLDMTKQGNVLPSQVFGTVMADLARLHSVVQNGRALAYSMGNLDAEFRNRFSGYGYTGNNWYQKYRDWSQTSLDSSLGALKAANLQASQMDSEEAVLRHPKDRWPQRHPHHITVRASDARAHSEGVQAAAGVQRPATGKEIVYQN